jgi:hypothetical protein
LSDGARLVYLQKRLSELRRSKRNSQIIAIVVAAVLALILDFSFNIEFWHWFTVWAVGGILASFAIAKYYTDQIAVLTKELERLSGVQKPGTS